jgi:hypothetical protein
MLVEESIWLKNVFSQHFSEDNFPLLNIGSSTESFRKEVQPFIYKNVFEPLELKKFKVIHTDIKPMPGVDITGDLNDADFRTTLTGMGVKSILCSNLLEHLAEPKVICNSILTLLKKGDLILVTVPYRFPFHKDPIDTLLRPTVEELVAYFPGTVVLDSAIVTANDSLRQVFMKNKLYFLKMLIRCCLPFYKFKEWVNMMKDFSNWNEKFSATCVLLKVS